MRAKKASRLLAMLLAVMMVVGMLPLTASAAMVFKEGAITATIKKVTPSGSMATFLSHDETGQASGEYNKVLNNAKKAITPYSWDSSATEEDNKNGVQANIDVVDGWFAEDSTTTEVNAGDYFYIAVDLSYADNYDELIYDDNGTADNATDDTSSTGVQAGTMVCVYDPTVFELSNSFAWSNPMFEGDVEEGDNLVLGDMYSTEGSPDGLEYWGDVKSVTKNPAFSLTPDTPLTGDLAGVSLSAISMTYAAGSSVMPFNATGWEHVYRVKVLDNAPAKVSTSIRFFPYPYESGASRGTLLATTETNGEIVGGGSDIDASVYSATSFTIKVKSTAPAASLADPDDTSKTKTAIANDTDRKIAVKLDNSVYVAEAELTKDDFSITSDEGGQTAATGVSITGVERKSDTVAVLTIDASGITTPDTTKYYVNVLNTAATKSATDATAVGPLSAGSITVTEKLAGTISYTGETTDGTGTYGDTITAEFQKSTTADPGTVKFQWFVGDPANHTSSTEIKGENSGISGDNNEKLTLGKQTDISYETSKIYAVATSATLDNTSYYDTTTNNALSTAKKALKVPTAISNIPEVDMNAEATQGLTVEDTVYTFTETDGIVTGSGDVVKIKYDTTYKAEDLKTENNPTVKIVLDAALEAGDQSAYYEITTNSVGSAEINNLTGSVSDKGYKIATSVTAGGTVTGDTVSLNLAGTVANTAGAKGTVTITGIPDHYTLTGVTEDVNGIKINSFDATAKTFEVEVETALTDTKVTVTPTITLTPKKNDVTSADFKWVGTSKTYDGTSDVDTTFNIDGVADNPTGLHTNKKDISLTWEDEAYYNSSDEETANVADASKIVLTGVVVTGDDAAFYNNPSTITITGNITAATLDSATGSDVSMRPADEENALKAIKGTTLTPVVTGAPDVAEIPGSSLTWATGDTELKTAITNAMKFYSQTKSLEADQVKTEITPETVNNATTYTVSATSAKVGDSLQLNLDTDTAFAAFDAAKIEFTTASTLITVDNTGKVTFTGVGQLVGTTDDITVSDGTTNSATISFNNLAIGAAEYAGDVSKLPEGESITVEVPASAITAGLENYNSASYTGKTFEVKLTHTKRSGGGVSTPTVNFVAEYADPEYGAATVNGEGKLDDVPGVTNMVKGAVFAGWSTTGTKAGIIDIDTFKTDKDVTLYGVFDGYIMGNAKNEINAGDDVTRAELIKMLVVAAGYYDADVDYGETGFSDTNGWYKNYIACAVKNTTGVIDGYTDGSFKPNAPVTRQEAAKFISGIMGVTVTEGATVDALLDFNTLPDWAKPYVAALYNTGAIDGRPNGNYDGKANITREETAKIINTFIGLTAEEEAAIVADTTINAPFVDMVSREKWSFAHLIFASLNAPVDDYSTQVIIPTR